MPGEGKQMVPNTDWPAAKPEDVGTTDQIINAYYASISAGKGEPRDWERLKSLVIPEMQYFSTRPAGDRLLPIVLKIDDFIEANRKYFEKGGYFEKEINRKTDIFGNIAQIFSTFESRHRADEEPAYNRGVNSFQLIHDGERWWIISVTWCSESPAFPMPAQYLPSPGVAAPAEKK